jgi:hypothetical protein
MQKYYTTQSHPDCLRKVKEAGILSVCFCSTDYCNSSNGLTSSFFLAIVFSFLIQLLLI